MKAVIIATGQSKRLLPLTKNSSVSFLELNGKPLIKHQLEILREANINEIIIVVGNNFDQFNSLKADNITILKNPFYDVGNILSSMWVIKDFLKSPFILIYNDIYFERSALGIINDNSNSDLVLAVRDEDVKDEAEKVIVHEGLIKQIKKELNTENSSIEFTGIALFKEKLTQQIPQILLELIDNDLNARFPKLVNRIIELEHGVSPYFLRKQIFMDIDTKEDLDNLKNKISTVKDAQLVYVTMCADPIHYGHINLIEQAKKIGDKLIVGLLTDDAIKEYKKPPLIPYEFRKIVVENIKGVDEVIAQQSGLDYSATLKSLKPAYLVHGDDWIEGPLKETRSKAIDMMASWNGKVIDLKYTDGICSTDIKLKIKRFEKK